MKKKMNRTAVKTYCINPLETVPFCVVVPLFCLCFEGFYRKKYLKVNIKRKKEVLFKNETTPTKKLNCVNTFETAFLSVVRVAFIQLFQGFYIDTSSWCPR